MEEMYKYVKDLNKEFQNNSFEQYIADINREGREIGQKRGLRQGQNIALKRTAKNLLQQNVSIEIIEKATGLSKKTILSLT